MEKTTRQPEINLDRTRILHLNPHRPTVPHQKKPRTKKTQRDRGFSTTYSVTASLCQCTSTMCRKVLWSAIVQLHPARHIRVQFPRRDHPTGLTRQKFR